METDTLIQKISKRSKVGARVLCYSRGGGSCSFTVPLLMMGQWAATPEDLQSNDLQFLDSPWSDRHFYYSEIKRIEGVYERLLKDLAESLNQFHTMDLSNRAWRILIGPWLMTLVDAFYDRLASVRLAASRPDVASFISMGPPDLFSMRSTNTREFVSQVCESDQWNDAIYDLLLRELTRLRPIEIQADFSYQPTRPTKERKGRRGFAEGFVRVLGPLARLALRRSRVVIWDLRIPLWSRFSLEVVRRQLPFASVFAQRTTFRAEAKFPVGPWLRQFGSKGPEEALLWRIAEALIPSVYLEGFIDFASVVRDSGLPRHPEVIFTTNAFFDDEPFKFYTALSIEQGTRLVVGQHGGGYGVGRVIASERHETAIADRFLSWGWKDSCGRSDSVVPVGNLIRAEQRYSRRSRNPVDVVLVMQNYPIRGFLLSSHPVGDQWYDYFDANLRFAQELDLQPPNQLIVRPYQHDYGREQARLWREAVPRVVIDEGREPLRKVESRAKLVVFGYCSTGILRGLHSPTPTLGFWDPRLWEEREQAHLALQRLRDVGYIHDSPESAASFVNENFGDLEAWWSNRSTISARREAADLLVRRVQSVSRDLGSYM